MIDQRLGNDIKVDWYITRKGGQAFSLEGLNVRLYLKSMFGRKELNDFVITGNIIQWTFYGKDQKSSGKYSLEMVVNEGEKGMITTDACDFVNLVSCSCKLQGGEDAPNVETESIELRSVIDAQQVYGIVDSELSDTSENPLQNKVITAALKEKQDEIKDLETIRSGAAKGETAIQEVKTINGQSIVGSGDIKIQGGSGDSPIINGEANNSAILDGEYEDYKNRAISQTSMAVGAGTIAGLKGWYYSKIDFTNKKITLSDKPTYILVGTTLINGGWSSGTPNIKVGDKISLVNDSKYDYCGEVASVSGNVITLKESLSFTELTKDDGAMAAVMAGKFSDGYSIYLPDRPDAGIIDFGGGGRRARALLSHSAHSPCYPSSGGRTRTQRCHP